MKTEYARLANLLASFVTVAELKVRADNCPKASDGWADFMSLANSAGFWILGAGHFSAAFRHDDHEGIAFKVGFKKEDSGAAYAAYCRANQGKAGIPVLHDIQRHEDCYTVVMDRYEPIDTGPNRAAFAMTFEMVQRTIEHGYAPKGVPEHLKPLIETANGIREFFQGIASFDCHDENVMCKDGQLYITDPVSFTRGIECWKTLEDGELSSEADKARIQMMQDKARVRKQRHMDKKENRKVAAKAWKVRQAQRKQLERKQRIYEAKQMNWRCAQGLMVAVDWSVWLRASRSGVRQYVKNHLDDHIDALIAGREIPFDKKLDAQFLMG